MKIKQLIITPLLVAGLLACCSIARAQDAKEGKEGKGKRGGPSVEQQMEMMTERLKLTDDQKPKVKAVLEDGTKKRQELANATPEERREKFRALMDEQDKKLKEVLTSDQYEQWQKMREERRNRGGGAPGGEKKEKKKE